MAKDTNGQEISCLKPAESIKQRGASLNQQNSLRLTHSNPLGPRLDAIPSHTKVMNPDPVFGGPKNYWFPFKNQKAYPDCVTWEPLDVTKAMHHAPGNVTPLQFIQ